MSKNHDYSKRKLDLTQNPRKWVISNRDYSLILDENLEKEIKKAVLTLSKSPQSKSAASEFLKRIDILKETVDVAVENKKKMLEIEESENKASFLSDMDSLIERVDMEGKVFSGVVSEINTKTRDSKIISIMDRKVLEAN